jgi:hypothetical protein
MRLLPHILTGIAFAIALATAAPAVRAQSGPERPPEPPRQEASPRPMMPPRNPASLSDSVRRAQRESGGQILGAERVQYDGREINRVKVMDSSGRVRYMDEDPQRGNDRRNDRDNDRSRREGGPPRARGDNPQRP